MADSPVKQVTRKPLSKEIDHRQDLSLDIVDIGWKFVEPDVVAMQPKTAKDDCPNDVETHQKAVSISGFNAPLLDQALTEAMRRRAKQWSELGKPKGSYVDCKITMPK